MFSPLDDHTEIQVGAPQWELGAGSQLGEYQLAEKIGEGGMGVVFAAVHPLIGKRAAIKILRKDLCSDPMALERFIDEARVVNEIGHPNIVDVFAFGEMPDGRRYFVMEWLKGESLRARIARGPVPLDETSSIVRTLARALHAAHGKGVIHRDLKPDNVFLVIADDDRPTVKLLDFGIAKLARNENRIERTATGAIVGTPQYIAPEQAKGYAIDHRADTYALGGMLFELLTGRPPFVADNAMEVVAKHLMEAPVAPSTFNRTVPPELDDLALRMLAKTPEARPELDEVIAVLRAVSSRESATAGYRASTFGEPSRPDAMPLRVTAREVEAAAAIETSARVATSPPMRARTPTGEASTDQPAVVNLFAPSAGRAVTATTRNVLPSRIPRGAVIAFPIVVVVAFIIVKLLSSSSAPTSAPAPTPAPVVAPPPPPTPAPPPPAPTQPAAAPVEPPTPERVRTPAKKVPVKKRRR